MEVVDIVVVSMVVVSMRIAGWHHDVEGPNVGVLGVIKEAYGGLERGAVQVATAGLRWWWWGGKVGIGG